MDYWFELKKECDVALDAVGRLNYDLVRLGRHPMCTADQQQLRVEVFETINQFLRVVNRISELVWLKKRSLAVRQTSSLSLRGKTADVKKAKSLQQRLSEETKRILNDLRLQEHGLKSQESSFGKPPEAIHSGFIGSCLLFPAPFNASAACSYDPISRKFQYQGDTFDIQEIAGAVYDLKKILRNMSEEHGEICYPVSCDAVMPLVMGT
jgi:hypothetical protein